MDADASEYRLAARSVFVDPISQVTWFGQDDERKVLHHLRVLEENTRVSYIEVATELLLDPDGFTVANQYRMTWPAVRHICRMICPGLGSVIADLSGYIPRKKNPPSAFYSIEAAVEAYNAVLTRRFDFIAQGTRMLINDAGRHIDAVVGRTYQRLPNIELFERVSGDLNGTLISASIASRRLHFWRQTYSPAPFDFDQRLGSVRFGVFARNYESGDGSILMCPAIGFGDPVWWAVRPPCPKTRVRHAGASFPAKFQEAVNSLRPKMLWRTILSEALSDLSQTSLGFEERAEFSADNRCVTRLIAEVRTSGLPISFSRRVVRRALYSGGVEPPEYGQLISAKRNLWPLRTRLDLFIALMAEASESDHPWVREKAEKHAYTMLSPTINKELFDVEYDDTPS